MRKLLENKRELRKLYDRLEIMLTLSYSTQNDNTNFYKKCDLVKKTLLDLLEKTC